jgi:hypothetical protein
VDGQSRVASATESYEKQQTGRRVMQQIEPFQLIDCFKTNEPVIDTWSFVFNEVNLLTDLCTG